MFITSKLGGLIKSKEVTYEHGHLLPVMPASELLGLSRYQKLLGRLKDISAVPEEHFEALYTKAINQFAEYVQVIPSERNGALVSLLNEGLARGFTAQQQFIADHPEHLDPLMLYASFTAGMLLDINKIFINQRVVMTNEQGEYIDTWNPFEGSMMGKGEHYKLYAYTDSFQRIEKPVTILLARQIVPSLGLSWLTSDLNVFADWLDALEGGDESGGGLSRALVLMKREDMIALADSLGQFNVDMIEAPGTEHADAFLEWLRNGLRDKDIKVNSADAHVFMVTEGVFLEQQIFKQFVEFYGKANFNTVFTQFGNAFGIAEKGGLDFSHQQFFSKYPNVGKTSAGLSPFAGQQHSLLTGVVMNPAFIFQSGNFPAITPLMKAMQTKEGVVRSLPSLGNDIKLSPQKK